MWVVFALGAAVLTSFNPVLYKRMLKDAEPLVVAWGVTLLAFPLLGLFTLALTSHFPRAVIAAYQKSLLTLQLLEVVSSLSE